MGKDKDKVLTQEEVDAQFMTDEQCNEMLKPELELEPEPEQLNDVLKDIARLPKPPTSGFHKLGSAAQAAARSRAKAFYPFD